MQSLILCLRLSSFNPLCMYMANENTRRAQRKYVAKHKGVWVENELYFMLEEEAAQEKRTIKKQLDYILSQRYEK